MPTFRINLPLEVSVGAEVDPEEFAKGVARLIKRESGPNRSQAAMNFLVSTKHLFREAAAWALATTDTDHDLDSALNAIRLEAITVTLIQGGQIGVINE